MWHNTQTPCDVKKEAEAPSRLATTNSGGQYLKSTSFVWPFKPVGGFSRGACKRGPPGGDLVSLQLLLVCSHYNEHEASEENPALGRAESMQVEKLLLSSSCFHSLATRAQLTAVSRNKGSLPDRITSLHALMLHGPLAGASAASRSHRRRG